VSKTAAFFIGLFCLWLMPQIAAAGAWLVPVGESLLITKFETASADETFDARGKRQPLSNWAARDFSVYGERGFSKGITLYARANLQSLKTPADRYKGFGVLEVGGRVNLWDSDWSTIAIGAGVEDLGDGRRNDFDTQRAKGTDKEIRLYGGHSFRLKGRAEAFVELQTARRWRSADADQWRVDFSLGLKPSPQWLLMAQTWAGKTDRASWGRAVWVNQELSAARYFGPKKSLTVQLAVRQTVYGENTPRVRAVSLSLWKRF
jgi:protein XagA